MSDDSLQRLVFFGDSLSDLGTIHGLTTRVLKQALPPNSMGYAGWFSNDLVQSGVTADLLGAEAEVYAAGGARALGSRTIQDYVNSFGNPDILLPDPDPEALATDTFFRAQVARFLDAAAGEDPVPGTAAAFLVGLNDYNALDPMTPPAEVELVIKAVVDKIVTSAGEVAATGIEKILLYNLPGPDFFPVPLPSSAGPVIGAHNQALVQGAELLRSAEIEVEIVDLHRITDEIVTNSRTFGLLPQYLDTPKLLGLGSTPTWNEATQSWVMLENPAVAGADLERVAFYDFFHPTSATHGVLGIFAAESLSSRTTFLDDGDDRTWTGKADDFVLGGAGDDWIYTAWGDDTVLAGLGSDIVHVASGNDIVAGGAGHDLLSGGRGDDVVAGSDGSDLQYGGRGDDLLVDGLGWDILGGSRGQDAFLYVEADLLGEENPGNGGRFYGGSGTDTLYLALDEATRATVEVELESGASDQRLGAVGVATHSIEHCVFIDPTDIAAGVETSAMLKDADLWGIV